MKGVVCLLVFVLMIGGVFGALDWSDADWSEDEDGDDEEDVADEEGDIDGDEIVDSVVSDWSDGADFVYTRNFYIALGVGGVGLLIVGYLVYSFLRRPRNRWKKRK